MVMDGEEAQAAPMEPIADGMNRRVVELRLRYPEIHGVDVDLLFLGFLLETARFGVFDYGPVVIDVGLVEESYVRSLAVAGAAEGAHRVTPGFHGFYKRLGEELDRAGTRRPNELHYLLAFMRSPEGLPTRIFGELGIPPAAVEAFARRQRRPSSAAVTPDVFLSPDDVAQRLGVNEQTVRAWVRSGKLPASRLAGRRVLRIRESDIESVLEPVDPADFR